MPDPRVKICGLTDPGEAAACAALGAWAIGVVFAEESVRRVDADRAAAVVAALPADVRKVGVFVDAEPGEIARIADACGLTDVQVHGAGVNVEETRDAAGRPVIHGFAVDGPAALAAAAASPGDLVLLDASVPGRHGGTGRRFDWSLLESVTLGRPFALAGGLDAGNVADAVRTLRPDVLDVSSGVERSPGRKDPEKVAAFIAAVAAAAAPAGAA